MTTGSAWLVAAGMLDMAAAIAHLCCIAGGARWYRIFGAGERMARAVERGSLRPHLVTIAIVAVLGGFAVYAFSGAGVIARLPLMRPVLIAVTLVNLSRCRSW